MKSVLIVEDEVGIHDVLEFYLENLDIEIAFAEDITTAKSKMADTSFDLILSDVHLKEDGNGIDLLKEVKSINQELPFIIMTSFISALDAKEAYRLGADEFVAKPINQDELRSKLMRLLGSESEESYKQNELDDSLFCEVPLKSFISGKIAPFDIYIKIRNGKYIKVSNKGDNYNYEILKKFENKGVEFLHALKKDFQDYTLMNLKICKALQDNKKIDDSKRMNFLVHSHNIIQESVFKLDFDERTMNYINYYAKSVLNVVSKSHSYFELLEHLRLECPDIYNYSLLSAIYALAISEKLEWESDERKTKLFLSGLLHDVGMKMIPEEIREKNPLYLTIEEKEIMNEHAKYGMEILSTLHNVPSEVILAAYQHHEDVRGSGFPLKLKGHKISPFSKIIYITNHFSRYYLQGLKQDLSNANASARAYHKFMDIHENLCEKSHLEAFKKLFPSESLD